MEVTKWLKPSDSVSRIGDRASVQAATRVNAEQALYGALFVKKFRQRNASLFLRQFLRACLQLVEVYARTDQNQTQNTLRCE